MRELATRPEKMSETLGAALSLIWVLTIVVELLILAILPFPEFQLRSEDADSGHGRRHPNGVALHRFVRPESASVAFPRR